MLNCFAQEFGVFCGAEEELDRLPHDPPFGFESGDSRISESCRVLEGRGLQGVKASQRFVDEGDRLVWCAQEELVVVAVQGPVEGCKLRRCEVWAV